MRKIKHIHFIGIAGCGMCGIADVLLQEGYRISGSDLQANAAGQRLSEQGATLMLGHHPDHVRGADVVVRSTAVQSDNVELMAAYQQGIPVVPRALMLAELMRFRYGIAVAGAHGKTTVTSLVTSLCQAGGLDPTYVIGGELTSTQRNAALGNDRYIVVEADESDASFLHLQPMITLLTNIDADHMATYDGDFEKLRATYLAFLHRLPFYGLAVVCLDDPVIAETLHQIERPVMTYGFSEQADWQAVQLNQSESDSRFHAVNRKQAINIPITLPLPGRHNIVNALGALAVAHELAINEKAIIHALQHFKGVGRRFQVRGELALPQGSALLVDDYGHHPREIAATLDAAQQAFPARRLVMLYQPHRFTRTRDLWDDFCTVLSQVDCLLLLPIYSAGEPPIQGVSSAALCACIRKKGKTPLLITDQKNVTAQLQQVLNDNDLLLAQGAGNIGAIANDLAEHGMFHSPLAQ